MKATTFLVLEIVSTGVAQTMAYIMCEDKDYSIVWAYVNTNASTAVVKCVNDTKLSSVNEFYGNLSISDSPDAFTDLFQASLNCESFYNAYQTGLRLVNPPCLVGNKTTTELAEVTFATFCLTTAAPPITHTTAPPTPTLTPSSNINYTAIPLGYVGGGVLVLALFVWLITRRMKRDSKGIRSLNAPLNVADDRDDFDFTAIRKYKISLDDLVTEQLIGTGAYAKVFIGSLQGKPVAIKKLLGDRATDRGIQDFIDEIVLTVTLDSPYIVKAFGAAWINASSLLCVLEYMDMGDLTKYLREHDNKTFSWTEKLKYIHCIVEALVYLSSISVIHRDLKSRNVLLDSIKGAKLADFGIAREDDEATMTREVGTFRWMAPEVLTGCRYSVAADIYSFGMVLSEFDSHEIPYHGLCDQMGDRSPLTDFAIIAQVRDGTLRPVFSPSCPQSIVEIAKLCLAQNPNDRPTSYQLSVILTKLSL